MKTIYLCALTQHHAQQWCNSARPKELLGEDFYLHYKFQYIDSVERIYGIENIMGFYLPGCENRPDYQIIKDQITWSKRPLRPVPNTGVIGGMNISGVILDEIEE